MGLLVEGQWQWQWQWQWQDKWYDTAASGGRFQRSASIFRNWITPDGSAGPEGRGGFRAEAGRYHLYVSLACPWAHRTLLMSQLKGLTQLIPVSVVHPLMLENGWTFSQDFPGATGDPLFDKAFLYQLYLQADPGYSGRVTVPVLWDKQQQTIVSNESADILRMFNSAFDGAGALDGDYYPLTCAPPLMKSTAGYTRRSIMASTKPASLPVRRPTMRRRRRFSLPWRD
ncbi:hypothetical protein SODG_005729 [Sodalis praecaptivus]